MTGPFLNVPLIIHMATSTDILKIDTPENVTFDYKVAGIGSRFLAALVDTAVIVLLQVIAFATLFLAFLQQDEPFALFEENNSDVTLLYWFLGIILLINFAFYWGYYIFFEILWNGQTPGKRLVGLRVIRLDGTPVSAAEVVIRNLARTIDLLPAAYGIGVVTMFVNENSRRLGDLAAGTVVVHERQTTRLKELTAERQSTLSVVNTQGTIPEGFPLERLGSKDIQILEEFLVRRAGLANRQQLAQLILKSLYDRLTLPADIIPTDGHEDTLAAIYKEWKNHGSA